jgi:hypothetical protein
LARVNHHLVFYTHTFTILYINSLSPWSVRWRGVLLAFSTAEPARPITDHWLAFSMAERGRTDGRTDRRTGFLQQRGEVGASPSSGFLLSQCVRLSVCDHWTQRKVTGKLDAGEKWRWTHSKVTGKR